MINKRKRSPIQDKTISVGADKLIVLHGKTNKHFVYHLEKDDPNRDIKLFGKTFKGVSAQSVKQDYLPIAYRQMLDDILYARQHMTSEEINELPLMRQYNVRVLGARVERCLNHWKKEIVSQKVDGFLLKLFPHSGFVKRFIEISSGEKPEMDVNRIDLFDLVSERQVVTYLQERNLFPNIQHELS